jgi:hypothetical protein
MTMQTVNKFDLAAAAKELKLEDQVFVYRLIQLLEKGGDVDASPLSKKYLIDSLDEGMTALDIYLQERGVEKPVIDLIDSLIYANGLLSTRPTDFPLGADRLDHELDVAREEIQAGLAWLDKAGK